MMKSSVEPWVKFKKVQSQVQGRFALYAVFWEAFWGVKNYNTEDKSFWAALKSVYEIDPWWILHSRLAPSLLLMIALKESKVPSAIYCATECICYCYFLLLFLFAVLFYPFSYPGCLAWPRHLPSKANHFPKKLLF